MNSILDQFSLQSGDGADPGAPARKGEKLYLYKLF